MSEQSGMDRIARRRQVVPVNGRKIELAALTIGDYVEVRRQALDSYRREQVHAWEVAAEVLSDEDRRRCLTEAVAKAAAITVEMLPPKTMEISKRAKDGSVEMDDGQPVLQEQQVEYGIWWSSETIEGRLFCAWLSMRACKGQEHLTLDDVDVIFTSSMDDLSDVANAIGELSTPSSVPNLEGRRVEVEDARRRKRLERQARRRGRK